MLDEYLRRCVEIYRFIFRVFVMLLWWYCAYISILYFFLFSFFFFFIVVIAEIRKVLILMEGRAGWFNENTLLRNWLVEYLSRVKIIRSFNAKRLYGPRVSSIRLCVVSIYLAIVESRYFANYSQLFVL